MVFMLYTLGLRDSVELDNMVQQFLNEENIETPKIYPIIRMRILLELTQACKQLRLLRI